MVHIYSERGLRRGGRGLDAWVDNAPGRTGRYRGELCDKPVRIALDREAGDILSGRIVIFELVISNGDVAAKQDRKFEIRADADNRTLGARVRWPGLVGAS